jgi:hypothetical protein
MPIDKKDIQDRLKKFDLSGLFTQELGWDWRTQELSVTIEAKAFNLSALAHKRGMVAYICRCPANGCLPDYPTRCKIEQQVSKSVHEHLIIFTDSAQTTQIWQWVKREAGKPLARREHQYHRHQTGEALIQKLQPIAFSLNEEETLDLVNVTSRTRAGFDIERVTKAFYGDFDTHRKVFIKFIEGIGEVSDREWYASVMLIHLRFSLSD